MLGVCCAAIGVEFAGAAKSDCVLVLFGSVGGVVEEGGQLLWMAILKLTLKGKTAVACLEGGKMTAWFAEVRDVGGYFMPLIIFVALSKHLRRVYTSTDSHPLNCIICVKIPPQNTFL